MWYIRPFPEPSHSRVCVDLAANERVLEDAGLPNLSGAAGQPDRRTPSGASVRARAALVRERPSAVARAAAPPVVRTHRRRDGSQDILVRTPARDPSRLVRGRVAVVARGRLP